MFLSTEPTKKCSARNITTVLHHENSYDEVCELPEPIIWYYCGGTCPGQSFGVKAHYPTNSTSILDGWLPFNFCDCCTGTHWQEGVEVTCVSKVTNAVTMRLIAIYHSHDCGCHPCEKIGPAPAPDDQPIVDDVGTLPNFGDLIPLEP